VPPATAPAEVSAVTPAPPVDPPLAPAEPPPAEATPVSQPTRKAHDNVDTRPVPASTPAPGRVARRPPPTGRLTLEAKPWARVYLGRRFLGVSPLIEVELPAGKTELRLVNPDTGIEKTVSVTISAGAVLRTAVDLRAAPP
jgi:serine/threonine-protein kinase